jgi:hypothetical protein
LATALGDLDLADCYAYVELVYQHGPSVGSKLGSPDLARIARNATFRRWWDTTVAVGKADLEDHYGPPTEPTFVGEPSTSNGEPRAVPERPSPPAPESGAAPESTTANGEPTPAPGARSTGPAHSLRDDFPQFPLYELDRTRSLFHQYGTEIGSALLLAALPEAYAAGWGARVLAATGHLQNNKPGDLQRRIRATAQFVTLVLGPTGFIGEGDPRNGDIENAWDPDSGPAFQAVMGLRLFHQIIRTILRNPKRKDALAKVLGRENSGVNVPLNQEDLLATQLLFGVTVFEVLEKFGMSWSVEDQGAYLVTWDLIGRLLGIQDLDARMSARFDPSTLDGARRLLALLRARQWIEVPPFLAEVSPSGNGSVPLDDVWNSLRPGRLLTKALLDQLTSAMGKRSQSWPLAAIRELTPPVVHDRLGLGASGMVMTLLDGLPRRTAPIGWFTRVTLPNPAKAGALRLMANTVTRQAVISFLRSGDQPPFVLPGLEDWTASLSGARSGATTFPAP